MVVVSSSTNEWPQSHHIDEKGILMASTRTRLLMEKVPPSTQEPSEQQQIQQGLKCPRCYSSNTKFCYYNNYSLSQPRHFCKACKRYWTRGGTLRNVPVGGGCRKKKRVKRQTSSLEGPNNTTSTSNNTTTTTSVSRANPNHKNPTSQPQMDKISSNPNHINPLLFGLPSSPSELNLPFLARFNPSSRVSSSSIDGYDLQPQLNALGLWFSSGLITSGAAAATTDHPNVFINPDKQIQEMGINPSNPLLSSYSSIFGSSSSTISSTSPPMATLLASSFNHQKFGVKDTSKAALDQFQTLTTTLEGLQMDGNIESVNVLKIEPGQSRLDWSLPYQNQVEQIGFADPNSLYWSVNPSTVGSWQDPANMGSSVTSLI